MYDLSPINQNVYVFTLTQTIQHPQFVRSVVNINTVLSVHGTPYTHVTNDW